MRFHPLRLGKWTLTGLTLLLAAALLMPCAGTALAAGPETNFNAAPLNPAFIQYALDKSVQESDLQSSPSDSAPGPVTGYIPPTMDLSHLSTLATGLVGAEAELPAAFDWRPAGKVTSIKDQGQAGTCWVFGTLASLESRIAIVDDTFYALSPQNVATGVDPSWVFYNRQRAEAGGNSFISTDTLVKKGTRLESTQPYNASTVNTDTCSQDTAPVKRVTDYRLVTNSGIDPADINLIKSAIYNYGPVMAGFHIDPFSVFPDSPHMFSGWVYDYPDCQKEPNHMVCLVGWDDSIVQPLNGGQGAWIAKNSWGAGWGNAGYFYLCYGSGAMMEVGSFRNADSPGYENYPPGEHLYYWDEAGMLDSLGAGDSDTAWMRSIFTAANPGTLTRVEFWTTSASAQYRIQVLDSADNLMGAPQSGTCPELGYYSIPLDSPIALSAGKQFKITVEMTTPGFKYPIPIECQVRTAQLVYQDPPVQPGVCFLSPDGSAWTDASTVSIPSYDPQVTDAYGCNIGLRAVVLEEGLTGGATDLAPDAATLYGSQGSLEGTHWVSYAFNYGVSGEYDQMTGFQTLTAAGGFSQDLTGLTPNTLYHYQAKVDVDGQLVYGGDQQFTTPNQPVSTPALIATIWMGPGGYLQDIAVNPITGLVYVAGQDTDNISVIDDSTGSLVATVGVGSAPQAVAVNPETNRIYVANAASDNVSVIDGSTDTVTATVNVGQHPAAIAVNPVTNRIYVADFNSLQVSVIDGASNEVIAVIPVGASPNTLAVNPLTNRIYVTTYAGNENNNLKVLNGSTNTLIASVAVGSYPGGVAVNPVANRIYVARFLSNKVSIIDGSTQKLKGTFKIEYFTNAIAVNPANNRIYVVNGDLNILQAIDGKDYSKVGEVSTGAGSWKMAVNPETNRIYVANYFADTVSVVQDGPFITTGSLADADARATYISGTLHAAYGAPPYKWSIKKGTKLPSGLTLKTDQSDTSLGILSGRPAKAGDFAFTIQVADSNNLVVEKDFTLHVDPAVTLTAPKVPTGEVEVFFHAWTPKASGGDGIYTWRISQGQLPDGLTLNAASGVISGMPFVSDTFPATLTVTDGRGGSASKKLSFKILEPLVITITTLPAGDPGLTYKTTTLKATGGASTKTWSYVGELPLGLSLSSKGVIKGKPAENSSGTYNFTVQVEDEADKIKIGKAVQDLSITINDPLVIDHLAEGVVGLPYSHVLSAQGGSGGYKFSKVGTWPKWLKFSSITGTLSGTPTSTGSFKIKVKVTDNRKVTATQTLTLEVKEPPLKIGMMTPSTGPAAERGKPGEDGLKDSLKYINNELNGIGGHPLQVDWRDSQYDPDNAANIVTDFMNEGDLLFTTMSSTEMTAAQTVANQAEFPGLVTFAAPDNINPPEHIYAHLPDYGDDWVAFTVYYLKNIWKGPGRPRMALHLLNNTMGSSVGDTASSIADKIGIDIVAIEEHTVNTTSEVESLTRILSHDPDVIYIASIIDPTAVILKDAHDLGISSSGVTIGIGRMAVAETLIDLAGADVAEGIFGTLPTITWEADSPGLDKVKEYALKNHPEDYGNLDYLACWSTALVVAEILRTAVNNAGYEALSSGDASAWQAIEESGIRALSGYAVEGLQGPVSHTPGSNKLCNLLKIYRITDGEITPVSDWAP